MNPEIDLDKLEKLWSNRIKKNLNPVTGLPEKKIYPEKVIAITRIEYEIHLNQCCKNFGSWLRLNEPEKFEQNFKAYKKQVRGE